MKVIPPESGQSVYFGRQRKIRNSSEIIYTYLYHFFGILPRILSCKGFQSLSGSSCCVLSGGPVLRSYSFSIPFLRGAQDFASGQWRGCLWRGNISSQANARPWNRRHIQCTKAVPKTYKKKIRHWKFKLRSWETARKSISSFTARSGFRNSGVIRCSCSRLHPLTPTTPPRSTLCSAAARLPETQTLPQPLSPDRRSISMWKNILTVMNRYRYWYWCISIYIYVYYYIILWYYIIPVVPHKAVAEVSKIGNL